MPALQVEIRFESDEEVSFLASNLHANRDDVVTFFVTTRATPGGRIKPGEKQCKEDVKGGDEAHFVLTFPNGSPFSSKELTSDPNTGRVEAVITTGAHDSFHYTFDGTANVAGKPVHVVVKGCPEIIIR